MFTLNRAVDSLLAWPSLQPLQLRVVHACNCVMMSDGSTQCWERSQLTSAQSVKVKV